MISPTFENFLLMFRGACRIFAELSEEERILFCESLKNLRSMGEFDTEIYKSFLDYLAQKV